MNNSASIPNSGRVPIVNTNNGASLLSDEGGLVAEMQRLNAHEANLTHVSYNGGLAASRYASGAEVQKPSAQVQNSPSINYNGGLAASCYASATDGARIRAIALSAREEDSEMPDVDHEEIIEDTRRTPLRTDVPEPATNNRPVFNPDGSISGPPHSNNTFRGIRGHQQQRGSTCGHGGTTRGGRGGVPAGSRNQQGTGHGGHDENNGSTGIKKPENSESFSVRGSGTN